MNSLVNYYYSLKGLVSELWYGTCRFFQNTWKYRRNLWIDQDWDFGFLDELVLTKLESMARYFRTAEIVEGEIKTYNEICLAIKLLKIVMEKEDELYYRGYVNHSNFRRFYPREIKFDIDPIIISTELRRRKAKHCLHLLLCEKEESWWD